MMDKKTVGTNKFKYNEHMYKTTSKSYVKVVDTHNVSRVVKLLYGYKCPKCGRTVYFIDKKTGTSAYFTSKVDTNNICLDNEEHSVYCSEPLHKYTCNFFDIVSQKIIGQYRKSPVSMRFRRNGVTRAHTTRTYIDRWYNERRYNLKYNSCYVEPVYSDDTDEILFVPHVKYRHIKFKTNDGARRSSGWKNSKKKEKQWQ